MEKVGFKAAEIMIDEEGVVLANFPLR